MSRKNLFSVVLPLLLILCVTVGCGKKHGVKGGGPTGPSTDSGIMTNEVTGLEVPGEDPGSLGSGELTELGEPVGVEAGAGTLGPAGSGPKVKIAELSPIYFEFDEDIIRPEQQAVLDSHADYLNDKPELKVEIQGHCDERGTTEYNLALGERRALAVRNYLIGKGVDSARLYTLSFGEEAPASEGRTPEAYALNRRAEFWAIQEQQTE